MAGDLLLAVLPVASAALWLVIGLWPFLRFHHFSPFERSLTAFALLLGTWALVDWVFLNLTLPANSEFAITLSNVRITLITGATFSLLLASKWIYFGHSRYDALLFLPTLGCLIIIWTGLTSGVEWVSWGPRLIRDPSRYVLWAIVQLAQVGAAIATTALLYRRRKGLAPDFRRRVFWTAGSLFVLLVIWLSTNIYHTVAQTAGVPWLSSLLLVPAGIILLALVPLSPEDLGALFRAVTDANQRIVSVYLFYVTGEPLVAVASDRTFPIEAERMQSILAAVGGFVEKSLPESAGYAVTGMRFDQQGVVAVRGQYVIAAALYDGPAYDVARSELYRIVRSFEEQHWKDLGTWEDASKVAEEAADQLSRLLGTPGAARTGLAAAEPARPRP